MNDPLQWAAHYHKRAAECFELADSSFDQGKVSFTMLGDDVSERRDG
jgi:hypothetical protein